MKNQTRKGDVICIAFIFGIMFSRKGVLWENKNPSRAWALGWNEIGFNLIAGLGVATPNAKRHAQCSTQRAVCQLFLLDRAQSAARRVLMLPTKSLGETAMTIWHFCVAGFRNAIKLLQGGY